MFNGEAFLERSISTSRLLSVKVSLRLRPKPSADIGSNCTQLFFDGQPFVYGRDSLTYLALIAEKLDRILDELQQDFEPRVPDLSGEKEPRYYEAKQLVIERESAVDLKWVRCYIEASFRTEDRLPILDEVRLFEDLFSLLLQEVRALEPRIVCRRFEQEVHQASRGDT